MMTNPFVARTSGPRASRPCPPSPPSRWLPSSCPALRSDKNVSRDSEPVSKLRDHRDAEWPAAVEDLGDAGAAADDVGQISAGEAHLFQVEADSVDRVGRVNGMVSRFVGVDEGYQDLQLVGCRRPGRRTPETFDFAQSAQVVALVSDGVDIHVLRLL